MCVYLCESVYSSVQLCRYKCICCRLLWITNGIEDGIWGKRAGRSSGRSAVFIHTHNWLYKLVCMETAFIRIYLMRSWPEDRAQLWQPFSLQLWQIVAEDIDYTHTRTHRLHTLLARGRALLPAFFEPALFHINSILLKYFTPLWWCFSIDAFQAWPERERESSAWSLSVGATI